MIRRSRAIQTAVLAGVLFAIWRLISGSDSEVACLEEWISGGTMCKRAAPRIDATWLWVNGSDPAWEAEKTRLARSEGVFTPHHHYRYAITRRTKLTERDLDELRYSMRSAAAHGPFGDFHLVLAPGEGQYPSWLLKDGQVKITTHRQLLSSRYLPTYQSNTIESALHNLPGLVRLALYKLMAVGHQCSAQ